MIIGTDFNDRYWDINDPDDILTYWNMDKKPVEAKVYYRHYPSIRAGSRVRVIEQTKYKHNLVNKIGTVRTVHQSNIAVVFDDVKNENSSYGYFYFLDSQLEKITDENMEENNMSNITNYLNIAKVKFIDNPNSCTYEYANFDPELKVGDLCVVKPAHHDMTLAKIVEIVDCNDIKVQREIIAKVDTSAYDNRVKVRKQAAELKNKMQERAKQLQDIALYQMLAKDDPAMMELLNEYQTLANT